MQKSKATKLEHTCNKQSCLSHTRNVDTVVYNNNSNFMSRYSLAVSIHVHFIHRLTHGNAKHKNNLNYFCLSC